MNSDKTKYWVIACPNLDNIVGTNEYGAPTLFKTKKACNGYMKTSDDICPQCRPVRVQVREADHA